MVNVVNWKRLGLRECRCEVVDADGFLYSPLSVLTHTSDVRFSIKVHKMTAEEWLTSTFVKS